MISEKASNYSLNKYLNYQEQNEDKNQKNKSKTKKIMLHSVSLNKSNYVESIKLKDPRITSLLQDDYKRLFDSIKKNDIKTFKKILSNKDLKWYLERNDFDYDVYIYTIKHHRTEFIEIMEKLKYNLNKNVILTELYFGNNSPTAQSQTVLNNENKLEKLELKNNDNNFILDKEDYLYLIEKGRGLDM